MACPYNLIEEMFRNRYARPSADCEVFEEDGIVYVRDPDADDSSPDLSTEYVLKHVGLYCRRVIWARVYRNAVTHHELNCACSRSAIANVGKLTRPDDFVFYFGKHKGKKITEVPMDYLLWAAANIDGRTQVKIKAFLDYLKRDQKN